MYNPSHPGEILKEEYLVPLNISITDFAKHLKMTRVALSRVLNCKSAISPTLAIKLEEAGLNNARMWLSLQMQYDLWQEKQKPHDHIEKILEHC